MSEQTGGRRWFVAWECLCTDVQGSPEALDSRCPHHDSGAAQGAPVEVTGGISTNLGHVCPGAGAFPRRPTGGAA